MLKEKIPNERVDSTFSVSHNNIASINRNLENVSILFDEPDFHSIVIRETKITISNENNFHQSIPGYVFGHVPTPLTTGGVELFCLINHIIRFLKRPSKEAFQAISIGIIYRHHNSINRSQSGFRKGHSSRH